MVHPSSIYLHDEGERVSTQGPYMPTWPQLWAHDAVLADALQTAGVGMISAPVGRGAMVLEG